MYDRMQALSQEEMTRLHDASMDILQNTGVAFNESESLEIFKKHGFKVDGKTVRFKEKDVRKALESTPPRFTITARNPDKSLVMGGEELVFAPGYGPPFVALPSGEQRRATMEDYDNLCKLIQTSKYIDMNGFMMVEPSDAPVETAYLDMLLANIVLCDKVFMGAPVSRQAAQDTVEMAAIVWGDKEKLKDMPVTVSLVTPLSPLRYSEEMAASLIELARHGQACLLSSIVMAGCSGPVTLPGVVALQNAEVLAGLSLAQLVRPGAPILYGSISGIMDMKIGTLSIGAPELSILASATTQMAGFYNLPSRAGGALTDAHVADAQAGAESTLSLITAARNGANFILEACGLLSSFLSMSYEKFLIDEELCGMIRRVLKPLEITDETIDGEMIKRVGVGGQYLIEPKTLELCATAFYLPDLFNRQNYHVWQKAGCRPINEVASDTIAGRLDTYQKPDIDPSTEKTLRKYVAGRRQG